MHVIGIDVGSQSVKALLTDESGAVLATASAPLTMAHPHDGWAEQDPASWEGAIAASVRAACEQAGVPGADVRMLGLACQVDGLVALGDDLRPLRPAIIWLDRRAGRQTDALAAAAGAEPLTARTGLQPDSSHTAPKAMWLRDEEPEHYRAARWLAPVGGHLTGWLTGEVVQDHANASSTLVYDVHTRAWNDELVGHAGLDADKLPPIRASHEVAGTPATRGGGGDGAVDGVRGRRRHRRRARGGARRRCARARDRRRRHRHRRARRGPGGRRRSSTTRASSRRTRTRPTASCSSRTRASCPAGAPAGSPRRSGSPRRRSSRSPPQAPPGAAGVLFVPALSGSMAPRWNDRMRGAFAGLAMNHGGEHLARAVLEGCTYALRDIVDRFGALGIGGDEIRVVGGGARSPLWLQIKADVTGFPVRPVEGDAATSAGAAMLAGVAAGNFADLEARRPRRPCASPRAGAAGPGDRRRLRRGVRPLPAAVRRDRAGAGVRRSATEVARDLGALRARLAAVDDADALQPIGLGEVLLGRGDAG